MSIESASYTFLPVPKIKFLSRFYIFSLRLIIGPSGWKGHHHQRHARRMKKKRLGRKSANAMLKNVVQPLHSLEPFHLQWTSLYQISSMCLPLNPIVLRTNLTHPHHEDPTNVERFLSNPQNPFSTRMWELPPSFPSRIHSSHLSI